MMMIMMIMIIMMIMTKVKAEGETDLPADISGARSQVLTVSNLVQGQYNFLLKVRMRW